MLPRTFPGSKLISMDLLVMDVVEKYISEQLPMDTIERNNGDFSYRPVTEGDRGYEHP
jgi:hypothetical protein